MPTGIGRRVKSLRTMLVLAHAADWISLIFFVPVVAFLVWLGVAQLRERRAARDPGSGADREP